MEVGNCCRQANKLAPARLQELSLLNQDILLVNRSASLLLNETIVFGSRRFLFVMQTHSVFVVASVVECFGILLSKVQVSSTRDSSMRVSGDGPVLYIVLLQERDSVHFLHSLGGSSGVSGYWNLVEAMRFIVPEEVLETTDMIPFSRYRKNWLVLGFQ